MSNQSETEAKYEAVLRDWQGVADAVSRLESLMDAVADFSTNMAAIASLDSQIAALRVTLASLRAMDPVGTSWAAALAEVTSLETELAPVKTKADATMVILDAGLSGLSLAAFQEIAARVGSRTRTKARLTAQVAAENVRVYGDGDAEGAALYQRIGEMRATLLPALSAQVDDMRDDVDTLEGQNWFFPGIVVSPNGTPDDSTFVWKAENDSTTLWTPYGNQGDLYAAYLAGTLGTGTVVENTWGVSGDIWDSYIAVDFGAAFAPDSVAQIWKTGVTAVT